jgi:membrane-associated phospholipid phosphatase
VKHLDHVARRSVAVLVVAAVLLFVLAAWMARGESVAEVDRGARRLIREGRPAALQTPMRVVSALATGYVLLPVTLACSVVLWRRRERVTALVLPAIGLGAVVALALTKWVIDKPRPKLRGYGFPSGHVFGVTVFVVIAVYLLWRFDARRGWQRATRAGGIVFVTAVGYSRIYVDAHWLSDVVGGLLAGIAFALAMVLVLDGRLR